MAAIYDIHGNLPALEAVLADIVRIQPDLIVVGGDVASGPMPAETVDLLLSLGDKAIFIRGNSDRELANEYEQSRTTPLSWANAGFESAHAWAAHNLAPPSATS